MRMSFGWGAALLAMMTLAAAEPPGGVKTIQPPPGEAPAPEPTPVIHLAVTPGVRHEPALRYALLPDALDLKPGNAAALWVRAGAAAVTEDRSLRDNGLKGGPAGTPFSLENKPVPLKDLPKEEIRAYLAHFAVPLRLADDAARRDHCDWEMPPLTMQEMDFPLMEIQHLRLMAGLLTSRCRLELSERRFDDALRTLQTGFALARDLGMADTLIQDLVGIAIGSIMFGQVQEWEEVPGSPNLYWALTDLPAPLVNVSRAMRSELNILYRSFPPLREVLRDSNKGALSEEETNHIVGELFKDFEALTSENMPDWQRKLGAAALALKVFPGAKAYLLEHGRSKEQVEAMTALQVVLIYFVEDYDRTKDDLLKWMNVAPWEARAGLDLVAKKIRDQGPSHNPIIGLLLPAVSKCYEARARIERTADYLRVAEALRLYAAAHDGKPPEKLEDVKLPLPVDPNTGEGFEKFYKVDKDGVGAFEVPPPPNMPPSLGRRFVLAPPK